MKTIIVGLVFLDLRRGWLTYVVILFVFETRGLSIDYEAIDSPLISPV